MNRVWLAAPGAGVGIVRAGMCGLLFVALFGMAACSRPPAGSEPGSGAVATAAGAPAANGVAGGAVGAPAAQCISDVTFYLKAKPGESERARIPTHDLFPRDIPDDRGQMAVNTRPDGTAFGWVDAATFRRVYVGCADSAFAARLRAGQNACEISWTQWQENGDVSGTGMIDVRFLESTEGTQLTPAGVDKLPTEYGFVRLKERGHDNTGWFPKSHAVTALRNAAQCPPLVAAAPTPQPAPPAGGEPSGDLQLLCEYQNGQAIVVRVDARARSAAVRLSTDTNWVTFVDGQTYNGTPPLVDAVAIDDAAIRIMRTPSDLGPEAKVSNNQTENDLANLVLGLGAVLATSSSAVIDRNTGVIRSEGMGGVFLHKGVGNCQPWEGRRF